MNGLSKNQKGFSAIETILVLIIVILIAAVGWLVYKDRRKPAVTSAKSSTAKSGSAQTKPADPYAGWKTYTLTYEKLTFRYPATWTLQDSSASQGLTPNADNVTLKAADGYQVSLDDGWDGSGDPLNLAVDSPVPVKFAGNSDYLVFAHPMEAGLRGLDPNSVDSAILMVSPVSQYTASSFPQDKNAHGDPRVNNGGSTMLFSGGYPGNAKNFATVDQAKSDPEFKNLVLVIQSMHY